MTSYKVDVIAVSIAVTRDGIFLPEEVFDVLLSDDRERRQVSGYATVFENR